MVCRLGLQLSQSRFSNMSRLMLHTWWCEQIKSRFQATKRPCQSVARRRLFQQPHLERLQDRLAPSTHVWTGGSMIDSNWSEKDNWKDGSVPTSDDSTQALDFPNDAMRLTATNDIPNLTVQQITFSNKYTLTTGFGIQLSSSITVDVNVKGSVFLFTDLELVADATITVAQGSTLILAGNISGAGGLTKDSGGELDLSGANTFTGRATVSAGTVTVSSNSALGFGDLVLNRGTLQSSGPVVLSNSYTVAVAGTIAGESDLTLSGQGTLDTATGAAPTVLTISNAAGTVELKGKLTGTGGLTKTDDGTLLLSGSGNDYTESTDIYGGSLRLGIADALPSTTNVSMHDPKAALLDLNGFSTTTGTLSGVGIVQLGTGVLTTGGGAFTGTLTGAGQLHKIGQGTLSLAGSSPRQSHLISQKMR